MNCDYTNVLEKDLAKAKVLFPTVASVIGNGGRADITLNANFYELGGNSLNSIYTVTKLRDQGYEIGITEFITAKNLAEVLDRMKISTEDVVYENTLNEEEHIFEMLNDSHKKDVIEYVKFILKIFFRYKKRIFRRIIFLIVFNIIRITFNNYHFKTNLTSV